MNLEPVTVGVIVGSVVLLIGYDVFAIVRGGERATISNVITRSSMRNPIIAFAFGFLMGHFFFSQGVIP